MRACAAGPGTVRSLLGVTFLVSDKKTRTAARAAPRTRARKASRGAARPVSAPEPAAPPGRGPAPPASVPGGSAVLPEIAESDGLLPDFEAARSGSRDALEVDPSGIDPAFALDEDDGLLAGDHAIALDDGIVLDDGIPLDDALAPDDTILPAGADPPQAPSRAGPTLLPGGGALVRLDPLGRYLHEVRRYSPLDRDEEVRLARRFRETGDPEIAQRLVTSNLILVVKIARLFRRAVVNVLDLIQEGNVGLLHALDRFDPEVGVKFSTYASWWIRAYILKYLLDNTRLVRVGTTNARRKLLYNLNREKRRLEEAGFSAGPKLLAEKFGVSERDVLDVEQSLSGGDVPLDAPVGEDGATTRGDLLASESPSVEDEVARKELKDLLDAKLGVFRKGLSEKDDAILDARLLADTPATLQEIGDRYGITREAVRQAEKRLTGRLREFLTEELGEEAVLQFRKR